jgi:hypothetical protein
LVAIERYIEEANRGGGVGCEAAMGKGRVE